MNQAFLPLYTEICEKGNRDEARLFASKSLGMVLLGTMLLTFLGIFFAPQLVLLFAAGFQSNALQYQLCVELTRWMFPYLVLVSLVAWATGILNAESRFAAPAAAPILLNLGIIGECFQHRPKIGSTDIRHCYRCIDRRGAAGPAAGAFIEKHRAVIETCFFP